MQLPSPFPIFPRYEQYLAEGGSFPANVHIRRRLEAIDSRCEAFESCRYASMFLQSKMLEIRNFGAAHYPVYARNLDRLLNWSFLIAGKSVFDWDESDAQKYLNFVCEPLPEWTANKRYTRFISEIGKPNEPSQLNPRWRPFLRSDGGRGSALVLRTLKRAYQVMSDFFKYIALNPPRNRTSVRSLVITVPSLDIQQVASHQVKCNCLEASSLLDEDELDWVFTQVREHSEGDDDKEIVLLVMAVARYTDIRFRSLSRERDSVGYLSQFQRRRDGSWVFAERLGAKSQQVRVLASSFTPHLERYLKYRGISPRAPLPDTHILMRRGAGQGFTCDHIARFMHHYRKSMRATLDSGQHANWSLLAPKLTDLSLSKVRRSARACAPRSVEAPSR